MSNSETTPIASRTSDDEVPTPPPAELDSSQMPDGGPNGRAGSAPPNEDKPYGRVATQHDVDVPALRRPILSSPSAADGRSTT
jgi:hypothetical protein